MMRQPDAYIIAYKDGTMRMVGTRTFERLVRGAKVAGFWQCWLRANGKAGTVI